MQRRRRGCSAAAASAVLPVTAATGALVPDGRGFSDGGIYSPGYYAGSSTGNDRGSYGSGVINIIKRRLGDIWAYAGSNSILDSSAQALTCTKLKQRQRRRSGDDIGKGGVGGS